MPTKNIECQLAQGQIGRYLNGERFSAQAIQQLESHVAECDECSELVTRRRQALLTMLGEGTTRAAVMATPSNVDKTPDPQPEKSSMDRLIAALGTVEEKAPAPAPTPAPSPEAEKPSKPSLMAALLTPKTLAYVAALAAVLIAMSYFSKNALKTFGPTVESSAPLGAAVTTQPVHVADPAPATKPVKTVATTVTPAAIPAPAATIPLKTTPLAKATPPPVAAADTDSSLDDLTEAPATRPVAPIKKASRPRIRTHRKPLVAHRRTIEHRVRRVHRAARRQDDDDDNSDDTPVRRPRARVHRRSATTTSTSSSNIKIYDPQGRSLN